MTRLALLLGFLVFAAPVAAQTIPVRSGEHGGFTRLVLDLDASSDWQLEEQETGFRFIPANPARGFDLSGVYRRITRDRVAEVTQEDGALQVAFGCRCEVVFTRAGSRMIALDIRPRNEGEREGGEALPVPPARPANRGIESDSTPETPVEDVAIGPTRERALRLGLTMAGAELPLPIVPPALPNPEILRAASADIIAQVGRAASQGLLTPRVMAPARPTAPEADKGAQTDPPRSDPILDTRPTNVRAVTSIDAAGNALNAIADRMNGGLCIPDAMLDIRGWAGVNGGLADQVGPLRRRMVTEFDRVDGAAALALARLYIHFGFGAEARALLPLIPPDTATEPVLHALSYVVDEGSFPGPNPFAGQEACDGRSALWALMAAATLEPAVPFDAATILLSFDELPEHLRLHLGPDFAGRLLSAGHADLADDILRRTNRAVETPTPAIALTQAQLLLERDESEAAQAQLETVIETDGPLSPDALVTMVDAAVARQIGVPPDTAERIDALVRENRGTAAEGPLRRALVLAHGLNADFESAVAALGAAYAASDTDARADLDRKFFRLIAQDANDEWLLRAVFGARKGVESALATDTGNRIAERLIEAGFGARAEPFITRGAEGDSGRARRILRARIALATDRPRRAEADLLGLAGQDVTLLRAMARRQAGDFAQAVALFREAGEMELAEATAFAGGLWSETATLPDDVLSEPAQTGEDLVGTDAPSANSVLDPAALPTKVLERNRALVEDSARVRAALEDLIRSAAAPG